MARFAHSYLKIENATRSRDHRAVLVNFANGDHVRVTAEEIRELTDPEFAKLLDEDRKQQSEWIGRRIRELRQEHGINESNLAEKTGLSLEVIKKIEEGNYKIDAFLWKVLAAMGCSAEDLVPRINDSPP